MHRSYGWLRHRWTAQLQRARATGALAVCLGIPQPRADYEPPITAVELEPLARINGVQVIGPGCWPTYFGGPLCAA